MMMPRDKNVKWRNYQQRHESNTTVHRSSSSSPSSILPSSKPSEHEVPHPNQNQRKTTPCDIEESKPRSLPLKKINWKAHVKSIMGAAVLSGILLSYGCSIATVLAFRKKFQGTEMTKLLRFADRPSWELQVKRPSRVLFPESIQYTISTQRPHERFRPLENLSHFEEADYGGLNLKRRSENKRKYYQQFRESLLEEIDVKRGSMKFLPNEDIEDEDLACRRPNWVAHANPNCNAIQELTIGRPFSQDENQDFNVTLLGQGYYRQGYRFFQPGKDHFVMKRTKLREQSKKPIWDTKAFYRVQKEANILEQMDASPRILDIYGFCGGTLLVEAMRAEVCEEIIHGRGFASQAELNKSKDVKSLNNLTSSEKLQISIDMAESIADIHGFQGGPITHADINIEQWLIAPDGSIKLNDFNNAREPLWDDEEREYCLSDGSYSDEHRSPEENKGGDQDESIDTYAFGNSIYTMLTGLWPYYNYTYHKVPDDDIIEKKIKGELPYIDPRFRTRSFIEGKLIEIMEKCWKYNRADRVSIFEVVESLHAVKSEAAKRGELEASELIRIPTVRIE